MAKRGPPMGLHRQQQATPQPSSAMNAKLQQAITLHRQGKLAEAELLYCEIVEQAPQHHDALHLLGVLAAQRMQNVEAVRLIDRALAITPDNAEALYNRGIALKELKRLDEALASYDRALAIKSDYAEALYNRGIALKELKRPNEALASYDKALAIKPDYVEALNNRGNVLQELDRFGEALASYDKALALAPGHLDARYNRAFARLLTGDFADGWRDYLARKSMRRDLTGVRRTPLSADLQDHCVLVLADQGLGDELFFLRFAAGLKTRGAAVLYRSDPRIAAMIGRAGVVDRVVAPDEIPPEPSLTVSVGDLPYLLGMSSAADIPPPVTLPPLPETKQTMAERLAALGPGPYIGVTWRAGTRIRDGALYKEAPHAGVAAALADAPGTVLALQRLPADGEVAAFAREAGRPVHDFSALNDSLEDMLAALALLDEYVCVSNTNVHLRAGTGRICRVLVPHPPEFRWMAAGNESPWFPGSRVYRQSPDGDWSAAFAALKDDLK